MNTLRLAISASLVMMLAGLARADIPEKTRQDIVNHAATGVGSPYIWGGGSWDPNDRGYGGADCSGFVSKAWSLTKWTPYRVEYHGPYSTGSLIDTPGPYWDEVDRADLIYGDAIVLRYDASSGHTYLYLAGDGWGSHEVYEARGSAYGIVHRWRETGTGLYAVKGIRRHALIENIGVTEHIVETDDGAPYYTDVGMTGNSIYDSYAPGCTEGLCRYRWVTATRNETCTFTPDLPETGRYRLYVTCNNDDPNVQGVGVTINHAGGSDRFTWNQADAATLNTWVPMGGQSFLFNAGMGNTVVWDDFDATPTDGAHIFRGDATKFSLDNRVEVDGVGGQPGTFATIHDALAWLAAHESEEPDVVNVTCDTLVETGCIVVDLIDDVTINGDADGNGVPVTIAIAASAPADWTRACGVYLDVPIQHDYTLRDVTIVPQYVLAGYSTGAYGLAIDEQNPSGEACAISVSLEGVTVAGSLPGNVATSPFENHRAQATMFGSSDASYGAAVLQRSSAWAGDAMCRQAVTATGLTITHSATRGLALQSAYTDWDIAGGLAVTYCGLEGIRAQQIDGSTLTVRAPAGASINRIEHNLGSGVMSVGVGGTGAVLLANCMITANSSTSGGGVRADSADTTIRDSVLAGNTATSSGGGIYLSGGSLEVAGCTIADNTASSAGAILNAGGAVTVANSILWANGAAPLAGSQVVTYSDVEGGQAGAGNIESNPGFVDADAADFHLLRSSPCINTGNPTFVPAAGETDVDGELRIQASVADMGADESNFAAGDMDEDGDVDLEDHAAFTECLAGPGAAPAPPAPLSEGDCLFAFDYDDDGDVDLWDFSCFRLRVGGGGVPTVTDVIVESRDASGNLTPPPAYVEDGAWANSTIKSTVPDLVGTGSRFITYDLPNSGTDNATFVPAIVTPGWYEVFVTWDNGANCYDAQYTVHHADGDTVLLVDQIPDGVIGANANTWVSLGQYRFAAGQDAGAASVNVSEETVSGKPHPTWNQRVYADAAKWVFVSP